MNSSSGHDAGHDGGTKRAAVYARVSTDEQADAGYGLDVQMDRCREYAKRQDWTVVGEFQESYTGRAPFGERPEGEKVVKLLKDGGATKPCHADGGVIE